MEPKGAPSAGLQSEDLIDIKSHDIGEEEERCILYQLRKRRKSKSNSEDVTRRMCPYDMCQGSVILL